MNNAIEDQIISSLSSKFNGSKSLSEEEKENIVTDEIEKADYLKEAWQKSFAKTRILKRIEKGDSGQTIKEGSRPLLWFNFYVYFRLPAGIILGILIAFLGSGADLFSKFDIIISCILFWGLKDKKLWAWKLNFAVLILETITIPLTRASNPIVFFILLAILGICWLLPNWIYFKNRKYLFLS